LFVALELPSVARDELVEWCARELLVDAAPDALRPVAREALHVTLCFLGWRAVSDIERVRRLVRAAAALETNVKHTMGAQLRLGEAAWIPPRRPRLVAVNLADATGALGALQSVLSDGLSRAGLFTPERRAFWPHVTVARVRRGARLHPRELAPPAPLELAGEAVTLYRSHPGGAGARYETLGRVPL
jgi:2'-5' RNA ligase